MGFDGAWDGGSDGGGGGGETTKPVVTPVSPAPGTPVSRDTPVVFDVTDNVALRRVWVIAVYKIKNMCLEEVVYNPIENRFGLAYQGPTNNRAGAAFGYRFTVLRDGGWPATPEFSVDAIDTSGNVAV